MENNLKCRFFHGQKVKHIIVKDMDGVVDNICFASPNFVEYVIAWNNGTIGTYSEHLIVDTSKGKKINLGFGANNDNEILS